MPAEQLAVVLHGTVAGACADAAAVQLIARHDYFLHQPAFRRIITAGSSFYSGQPVAVIRWRAAIWALEHDLLPSTPAQATVLQVAASLGDEAVPVHLRALLGGLDSRTIALITAAITAANGS